MLFADVIGQSTLKAQLIRMVRTNRLPHALLFCGTAGVGKLPLALALAQYINCPHATEEDACGTCPSCVAYSKVEHVNLHFAFPIIKKGSSAPRTADYLKEWQAAVRKYPYLTTEQWHNALKLSNQQPMIYASQSDEIQERLLLKVEANEYKVMVIWLPEKLNEAAANKLLKLIEEPYPNTLFLLITDAEEEILPTIISRTQRIQVRPIEENVLADYLIQSMHLSPTQANDIARCSHGSVTEALAQISLNDEQKRCHESFKLLMRLAWMRDIIHLKEWSETEAETGREQQKQFLHYCLEMIRENFVNNFHTPSLVYMNEEERIFAQKFSPFINERNILLLYEAFSKALAHIEQNVAPKMVFFDLALQSILFFKH